MGMDYEAPYPLMPFILQFLFLSWVQIFILYLTDNNRPRHSNITVYSDSMFALSYDRCENKWSMKYDYCIR
jgi:hypothetical protein